MNNDSKKKLPLRSFLIIFLILNTFCIAQTTKSDVRLIFMVPGSPAMNRELPLYKIETDTNLLNTYMSWVNNEPAQWAIDIYGKASNIADEQKTGERKIPVYYIALVQGGNNAASGFRFQDSSGIKSYPDVPYIKLAPKDWLFTTTFLHETGHIVLYMLNNRKEIPKKDIASISHTTAALTDRGTAFDEGFAIHLETLAARFSNDPIVRQRYHHDRYFYGTPITLSEYDRQASDLFTFSQTRSRYYDVAENSFAFCSGYKGPDYFRVQLEKSRDYSLLRNPDQLLQAEGFYASFFYSFLMQGKTTPTLEMVKQRLEKVLKALASMFISYQINSESPFLINFTVTYMRLYPQEAPDIIEVLLELSHGVFVDANASTMWRDHYLGALRLDMSERNNDNIISSLNTWRNEVIKDPKILYSRLGKQIRCTVPGDSVKLIAFHDAAVLSFDINTVQEGIMHMIPQISDSEIRKWLIERDKDPYVDIIDFQNRSGLNETTLKHLEF